MMMHGLANFKLTYNFGLGELSTAPKHLSCKP